MRSVGLDVHRDFCEVAILDSCGGRARGRVASTPQDLELFAGSLAPDDRVALEVTGNAWEIARILEPHVARVVVVSPSDTGIRQARAKTDRLDALALARLLAAGSLDAVWMPDEPVRAMRRRLARRAQLVSSRSREPRTRFTPCSFAPPEGPTAGQRPVRHQGPRGGWRELELPAEERETVDAGLRHIAFLDGEIAEVERVIALQAMQWPEIGRLMTVPGVNVIVAATFLAAVGDIRRFPNARKLVGYLGLDPKVRQSGEAPAKHGRISKQGSAPGRHALVEAAWSAVRAPGPLRAFYQRIRARRGHQVAIVAAARKLACLFWCMLTRAQDYAYGQPSLTAQEAAAPGNHRRRSAPPGQVRYLGHQRRDAPGRTRPRPPSRTRLQEHRQRLGRRRGKGGRERDTGARISKALEGQSRAADSVKPQGLRFASSVTRAHPQISHRGAQADQHHLTFIRRAKRQRGNGVPREPRQAKVTGGVGSAGGSGRARRATVRSPFVGLRARRRGGHPRPCGVDGPWRRSAVPAVPAVHRSASHPSRGRRGVVCADGRPRGPRARS